MGYDGTVKNEWYREVRKRARSPESLFGYTFRKLAAVANKDDVREALEYAHVDHLKAFYGPRMPEEDKPVYVAKLKLSVGAIALKYDTGHIEAHIKPWGYWFHTEQEEPENREKFVHMARYTCDWLRGVLYGPVYLLSESEFNSLKEKEETYTLPTELMDKKVLVVPDKDLPLYEMFAAEQNEKGLRIMEPKQASLLFAEDINSVTDMSNLMERFNHYQGLAVTAALFDEGLVDRTFYMTNNKRTWYVHTGVFLESLAQPLEKRGKLEIPQLPF